MPAGFWVSSRFPTRNFQKLRNNWKPLRVALEPVVMDAVCGSTTVLCTMVVVILNVV